MQILHFMLLNKCCIFGGQFQFILSMYGRKQVMSSTGVYKYQPEKPIYITFIAPHTHNNIILDI